MPQLHKMKTSLSIINDLGMRYVLEETRDDEGKSTGARVLRVATHEDLHRIPFHPQLSISTMVPVSLLLPK